MPCLVASSTCVVAAGLLRILRSLLLAEGTQRGQEWFTPFLSPQAINLPTIKVRKQASGSTRYTAVARIRRGAAVLHQESRTFTHRTAAPSWAEHRKVTLEAPAGLIRQQLSTATLAELIRWYIDTRPPGNLATAGVVVPILGAWYCKLMRIIARRTLREFVATRSGHKDKGALRSALDAWFHEAQSAQWLSSADVKESYATASIVSADRVVFNIKGNSYRLVVAIDYEKGIVWIKWLGTHLDYDQIEVTEVEHGN